MTAPSQGRHPTGTATSLAALYAPQIKGKIILTTGVSPSGLGAAFVKVIAKWEPSVLILAGRNASKVQATAKGLVEEGSLSPSQVRTLEVDLASLGAVRAAATTINNWKDIPSIDILVNNAGIMAVEHAVSPDGYESQLATNHLGPFLFTNLIMGKVLASAAPRIVMVSSDGHRLCPFRFHDYNFRDGETYNRWQAYGQSKSANMLMALSLAQKLGLRHNLLAFSLHPGVINTALGDHLDWNTAFPALRSFPQQIHPISVDDVLSLRLAGSRAATHVFAAFDPDISEHNGAYLQDCHIADPWTETVKPWATSAVEAEKLWKMSEQLVGQKFDY
ncbi:hypothetical protein N7470_006477 [Penicillium chermesinum]|nr:hypothetical protein N7470_006477 [Penicillium chermesinum]